MSSYKRFLAIPITLLLLISVNTSAKQQQAPSQARENDFPSVRGYDPGHPIAYDPADPYVALEYVNQQFDGFWTDIDGIGQDRKTFTRAPMDEDYTDPNRPNPTPNTPSLTPAAAEVFRKMMPLILAGNNPAQASGSCWMQHAPTAVYWSQFMFTPDSMDVSAVGAQGVLFAHIYMDGRPHPSNLQRSETGHQIAHWEGDTLVIDSVGFEADRDIEIGLLNSDQEHVITRYTRIDPDILEAEYTIIDPKVLTKPWTFKRRFRRTSMELNLLRDSEHCVGNNPNPPDPETGANQLTDPDGKKLQKVPKE